MIQIQQKILETKEYLKARGITYSDEKVFVVLSLQYLCFKENDIDKIWHELEDCITDGSNDGGIDYVYFDEDEVKLIVGQNKYSENIEVNDVVAEIRKLLKTLDDFNNASTGIYNKKLKEVLQNNLDRLTDETVGNIDIYFTSLKSPNIELVSKQTNHELQSISGIKYIDGFMLSETIEKLSTDLSVVKHETMKIDKPKSYVSYENTTRKGIFVNISSKSLIQIYNKHSSKGLFNLNIRGFVTNKSVDSGINNTLNKDRENFWFLNNGLTIACSDFDVDGNVLELRNFSIVNGGQTTTLIGKYKGHNKEEFFIPCKVIMSKSTLTEDEQLEFFNDIAEATNSQKPIMQRDLRSNSREMISLKNIFSESNIDFEIKRGSYKNNKLGIKIKNDVFAQLLYSFVYQKPGTARSNKNALFSNNKFYNSIFRLQYQKNIEKQDFIIDLVNLHERYNTIEKNFKKRTGEMNLDAIQANVYSNGKLAIFALMGVIYSIINEDITSEELLKDSSLISTIDFTYGSFISNYKSDDIDVKLRELIKMLIQEIEEEYTKQFEAGKVTSVSNFLKTDSKYLDDILKQFINTIKRDKYYDEIFGEDGYGQIFKRAPKNID